MTEQEIQKALDKIIPLLKNGSDFNTGLLLVNKLNEPLIYEALLKDLKIIKPNSHSRIDVNKEWVTKITNKFIKERIAFNLVYNSPDGIKLNESVTKENIDELIMQDIGGWIENNLDNWDGPEPVEIDQVLPPIPEEYYRSFSFIDYLFKKLYPSETLEMFLVFLTSKVPRNLFSSRKFVLAVLARYHGFQGFENEFWDLVSCELKNNKRFVLNVVSNNGSILQFASESLKKDKEVVLSAITENFEAYEFASDILKSDDQIISVVLEEIENEKDHHALLHLYSKYGILKYFSYKLAIEFLKKHDPNGYEYLADDLKNDKAFVFEVLLFNPWFINTIDKEIIDWEMLNAMADGFSSENEKWMDYLKESYGDLFVILNDVLSDNLLNYSYELAGFLNKLHKISDELDTKYGYDCCGYDSLLELTYLIVDRCSSFDKNWWIQFINSATFNFGLWFYAIPVELNQDVDINFVALENYNRSNGEYFDEGHISDILLADKEFVIAALSKGFSFIVPGISEELLNDVEINNMISKNN
jgi:hypothetical protein